MNWQTHELRLWLLNDEDLYIMVTGFAQQAARRSEDEEAAITLLAGMLENITWATEFQHLGPAFNLRDLLQIDYHEIADDWRETIQEYFNDNPTA